MYEDNISKLCYTIDEFHKLKLLPIGKSKLYELVNSSGFPAIRIGRKIIIPKKAFEKWLESFVASEKYFICN